MTALVTFWLDDQRYALGLGSVERVVQSVEVTHAPKAPDVVIGLIDVGGQVVPVVNVRKRFGKPERPVRPEDFFILARTPKFLLAMVVDHVDGTVLVPEAQVADARRTVPGLEHVQGVATIADGLVFIHDIDPFL